MNNTRRAFNDASCRVAKSKDRLIRGINIHVTVPEDRSLHWPHVSLACMLQLREYTLTETYHEDDVEVEFVSNDNLLANSPTPRGIDPNRDLNEAIAEERKEMDTQRYRYVCSLARSFLSSFSSRVFQASRFPHSNGLTRNTRHARYNLRVSELPCRLFLRATTAWKFFEHTAGDRQSGFHSRENKARRVISRERRMQHASWERVPLRFGIFVKRENEWK